MPTPTRTATSDAGSLDRIATARALATDAACAEVVSAWQQRGIDSILLKGPTTAEWLYPNQTRAYSDADLLVAPHQLPAAASILREVGFVAAAEPDSEHAHPWLRTSDRSVVDLHVTLWGSTRPPARVWQELRNWAQPYRIGPVTVQALEIPARALHIALHAAQHRDDPARRKDLRRALRATSSEEWHRAEQLADRLWALPMMAVGLQLEPGGRELLDQLPLASAGLKAEVDRASLAIGFARLSAARGLRAKIPVLRRALLPEGEDRERVSTIGECRRVGRRALWLLRGLPRTLRVMCRPSSDGRKN